MNESQLYTKRAEAADKRAAEATDDTTRRVEISNAATLRTLARQEEITQGDEGDDAREAAVASREWRGLLPTYDAKDPANLLWAYMGSLTLAMTLSQAESASHHGQCDNDVAALVRSAEIDAQLAAMDPAEIARELKEYGAWDDEELADHVQNLHRFVWLAAEQIRDASRA